MVVAVLKQSSMHATYNWETDLGRISLAWGL